MEKMDEQKEKNLNDELERLRNKVVGAYDRVLPRRRAIALRRQGRAIARGVEILMRLEFAARGKKPEMEGPSA